MIGGNINITTPPQTYQQLLDSLCASIISSIPQDMVDNPEDYNYMYRVASRDGNRNVTSGEDIVAMFAFRRKSRGDCTMIGNPIQYFPKYINNSS